MHSFLLMSTLVLNSALPFRKLLVSRVPARYIRDFALFNVCPSSKNCPSARCASAADVCRDVDVFRAGNVHLNHFL
jgi:hypothetical protein